MNTQILNGYDKFILFGTDEMGLMALNRLREENISVEYFCDDDNSIWGSVIEGIRVISPPDMKEYIQRENALVIICSRKWRHLYSKQLEELDVPFIYFSKPIYVEISSFCNQACTFCPYEYIKRKKSVMDPNTMKAFLYDLRSDKSDVLFPALYPHVMGEPLVCKNFFLFMDICKELGYYVCVVTNWALMKEDIQRKLFTEYPDMDIILSWQGASEKAFAWRKEKTLTYEQWIDLMFEIMESKFEYAHRGLIQISTIFPEHANNLNTRSDSDLHLYEWYDSKEDFKKWKRDFGGRCVAFDEEMKRKYPENYIAVSDAKSPIVYYYHMYRVLKDLDDWINIDRPSQFEFSPNIHIYEKVFGVWYIDDFFTTLLPEDKYLYWEENWHAMTEKCDRVGDVALLSSGHLVPCNVDNEADFILADLNKGERYTDSKTQARIREIRDNLSLSALCRRCKARALVFDTTNLDCDAQEVIHYGIRWHRKREDEDGNLFRVSYEFSSAYAYPCIDAHTLEIDLASVQTVKQFTLIKILSLEDETAQFTERRFFSIQLEPGARAKIAIPYDFEKSVLHRIDFYTATQNNNRIDDGVAVYSIRLMIDRQGQLR